MAYCPRSLDPGTPDTRVFRRGKWTHETEAIGPLHVGMHIAWSGDDPLGVDEGRYKFLETFLGKQARVWLRDAANIGGATRLSPSLWASVSVGSEGFESVREWQVCRSVRLPDHMLIHNRKPRCTYLMRDTNCREEGINPACLLFPYTFICQTNGQCHLKVRDSCIYPFLIGLPHVNIDP